ncbi:MAG: hypothetical protein U0325_15775 [Polyangiales bacterium]
MLAATCGGEGTPAPRTPPAACAVQSGPLPTPPSNPVTVVRLDPSAPAPVQLAVQACAGLRNRAAGGSVFVDSGAHDAAWLPELAITPASTVTATEFLRGCVTAFPACVRYEYASQRALLPNVLTVAAALGALPVDASLGLTCARTAFDAVEGFRERNTPLLATRYVFEQYGAQTTGLAMLNPGYDMQTPDQSNPPITRDMGAALVDTVFARRLFVVFLVNGCTAGHPERALLSTLANAGRWPTPVGVYGYNSSWLVAGGYLHEAQTRCLDSRNMGAIASEANNLSFFATRAAPIRAANVVRPNALEGTTYDPARTYVAFVVGDGDNIAYMLSTRRDWFRQRLASCAAAGAPCPPLTWTISPHLAQLAPDVLRWYYEQARRTGRDYFALPPSGHLYAYPSSLAPAAADAFVAATEEDACILGLGSTVHWDWNGTWRDAEDRFLPKYAREGGPIRGVFAMNVPYPLPAFTSWPDDQFYAVLSGAGGGRTAVFRPRSWRGVRDDSNRFFYGPQRMSEEINGYPRGTVTWVYLTSDGGLTLETSYAAILAHLAPHVQLVSTDTAARLALAARPR